MNKKRALVEIEEIGTYYGINLVASANRSGIIVKMSGHGAWQPVHRHLMKREEYFVFDGVLVLAILGNHRAISLQVYHAGESFVCDPGRVHTVYTPEDTLFGVISSGGDDTDFPEPSMDKEIQFIDMRGLILDRFV